MLEKNISPFYLLNLFLLLSFLSLFFLTPYIWADNLRSDSYRIDMGNLNMTSGRKDSNSYVLTDTVGQTFQGQFDSNGYRIRAGFQYIHSLIPFSFQISDLSIDLGTLVAETPSTTNNQLTITTGSAFGYSVYAIEAYELRTGPANAILDTPCDSGTTCTISDANIWTSTSTYGFGYSLSGDDIDDSDFIDSTYYRPFANNDDSDSPVSIMSSTGIATSSAATVTYKANVSSTQPSGYYTTIIKYIAVPSF